MIRSLFLSLCFSARFTAQAGTYDHIFDWCIGDEAITWSDSTKEVVSKRIADGAKLAPIRDKKGRIKDLNVFVEDRLRVVPQNAEKETLPTLIMENDCVSVLESTADCGFDSAGTPAPHKFAIEDGIDERSVWEKDESFTVVYVPAPVTSGEASEITKADKSKHLATLKVRGNSSRSDPKKQFSIKFHKPVSLIPDTPPAKKWIISAKLAPGQPDKTYVGNPAVFASYRRYGELQKKYLKSWPEKGSVEDLAASAWAPNTLAVNLIFQGRYIGVYNIMDRVEVLENGGRVWMPDEATKPKEKYVGGVKIPKGNYFMEQDSPSDAGVDYYDIGFQFPSYPAWVASALPSLGARTGKPYLAKLPYLSIPQMTIAYPKDETFLEYKQDEESKDVSALRRLLVTMMEWAKDPVANDNLLAQVIDMKSFARWYLTEEITREGDAYIVSQKWKFVKGKMYHASPWDFGGNSFMMTCNSDLDFTNYNGRYIDYETNEFGGFQCDNSTDYFYSKGWHVDSLWALECAFAENASCKNVNSTNLYDIRHFYRHLFRAPSLQKEFWALFDLVREYGLVDDEDRDDTENEQDMFNFGGLIDLYYNKVRKSAEVDLKMWTFPNALTNMAKDSDLPVVSKTKCKEMLYKYLRASGAGGGAENVTSIPAADWSFDKATVVGNFSDFFQAAAKAMPSAAKEILGWNWPAFTSIEAVNSAKNFITRRLEWISSQREVYEDTYLTDLKAPRLKKAQKKVK